MNIRTMYAVCPMESHLSELIAIFDDVTHAETYCEQINSDPDVGCQSLVATVRVDTRGIVLDDYDESAEEKQ